MWSETYEHKNLFTWKHRIAVDLPKLISETFILSWRSLVQGRYVENRKTVREQFRSGVSSPLVIVSKYTGSRIQPVRLEPADFFVPKIIAIDVKTLEQ